MAADCDVYFTEYANDLMAKRGLNDDDETLIRAILSWEPLSGKAVYSNSAALRRLDYVDVRGQRRHDVVYGYFPNTDIQLTGQDVAIVISIENPESRPGQWPEPESVARIIEMIADLTRYVLG